MTEEKSEISFEKELVNTRQWIENQFKHFNTENPDPQEPTYTNKYNGLVLHLIACLGACLNVNARVMAKLEQEVKNLKTKDVSPTQSETNPETSRLKEQNSVTNLHPSAQESQACKPSPKRILRKKATA